MGARKYTYKDVLEEFNQRNYKLISDRYINGSTKLEFICLKHKDKGIQKIDFYHLHERNQGCKFCMNENKINRTIDNYVKDNGYILINKHLNGSKSYIEYICQNHSDKGIQKLSLKSIYHKQGCLYCGYEKVKNYPHPKRTKEENIVKFFKSVNNIVYIKLYFLNGRAWVKYKCLIHNRVYDLEYNSVKRYEYLCEDCRYEARRKQTFVEDMYLLNPNIDIISEYKGDEVPVMCRCRKCNEVWSVTPCSLLSHPTCPKCRKNISQSETNLSNILSHFGLNYVKQKRYSDCRDTCTLPFDFYLSDFDILIEYDGEDQYYPIPRHNEPETDTINKFLDRVKKDKIKTEYCRINNISLIRIPYWERDNMEYFLFDELVKCGVIEEIKAS
jgi:hypothetical protein